jgi:hypothetical protein
MRMGRFLNCSGFLDKEKIPCPYYGSHLLLINININGSLFSEVIKYLYNVSQGLRN